MKKPVVILLCIFSMCRLVAQDPNAEDIVSKHLKATGHYKFSSMNTAKMTGKLTIPQQGLEMQVVVYQKKPDKVRQEMEVQGLKVLVVFEGKTGWLINPMMGANEPQDMDEASIKALLDEGRIDPTGSWDSPLMTWKEDGTKIELSGKEEINGSQAFNLKFTYTDGITVNYLIDASTFLLLKTRSSQNVQGQTFDRESRFSDYKGYDGILFPGKIEMLVNGQVGQAFVMEGCDFNIPLDDSIFSKPVKN